MEALEGTHLLVVKLPEVMRGFVMLPRRWVEGSLSWATRFRRLTKDNERAPGILAGMHVLAFATLMRA